eukprot:m.33190 g.33190  ORF g.33190 m.33190 type:complete len:280 (+) comp31769_c0_seq2:37-876(+)
MICRFSRNSSRMTASSALSSSFYGNKSIGSAEKEALERLNRPLSIQLEKTSHADGRWYTEKREDHVYPSVTSVLGRTMPRGSRFVLWRWMRDKKTELGKEGMEKLRKDNFGRGIALHEMLEEYFRTGSVDVTRAKGPVKTFWESVRPVLDEISQPLALESTTVHKPLHYAGTFDCIALYRNNPCLIEWKTSDRLRPTLAQCYDFPLQAAAYAGAVNEDTAYPFKVEQALVVVAYSTGEQANAHWMPRGVCEAYWDEWLKRLDEYRRLDGFSDDFDSTTL